MKLTIAYFYKVMDDMQDEVLVMYQEVKALTKDALPYVLNKELRMVGMFEKVITKCVENGELSLTEKQISLVSHNIFVQGQMWSFRRWALHKQYTLQEYVELQTQLLIQNVSGSK
ncbi:hypothetical protein Q5O89_04790 [Peribacillus frigoritolerans]|nr:hypothetical protein [Peribacillus frigoritolerans]